jgi:hypothetical protein
MSLTSMCRDEKNLGFTMDNKIYDFQKNLLKWIESGKAVCFDIDLSRLPLTALMKKALALQRNKGESEDRVFY